MYVSGRADRSLADSETLAPADAPPTGVHPGAAHPRSSPAAPSWWPATGGSAGLALRAWLGRGRRSSSCCGLVAPRRPLARDRAASAAAWVLGVLESAPHRCTPRCGPSCSSTRGGSVAPAACSSAPAACSPPSPPCCSWSPPVASCMPRAASAPARQALGSLFSDGAAAGAVDGRYNVLLLGADTGKDRVGTRPDSIQLVSIDARTGRAGDVRLRPRHREHRLPARLDHGPADARGLELRRPVPAQRLYTWGQDHAKRSSRPAPRTRGSSPPARRSRR